MFKRRWFQYVITSLISGALAGVVHYFLTTMRKSRDKHENKVWTAMMILFASTVLAGCATIMGKNAAEALNVRSAPDQANVVITDESGTKIFEGKTPTSLPLEKKKGFFSGKKYAVTIKKEGFADQTVIVDTKVNGWYIGGNLLFGGFLGWLIIDPATAPCGSWIPMKST